MIYTNKINCHAAQEQKQVNKYKCSTQNKTRMIRFIVAFCNRSFNILKRVSKFYWFNIETCVFLYKF